MLLTRRGPGAFRGALLAAFAALLSLAAVPAPAQTLPGGLRVVFAFAENPGGDCEIELTADSVRFRAPALASGRLLGGRRLSPGERDSAQSLMSLASRWTGYRRYACRGQAVSGGPGKPGQGYAFSLWSDSLLLACDNCFSCTDGMSLPDARVMARFGKMTLWLYRMREGWRPE